MPINLRYGQQAVSRGFINQPRLQQVLAKQKQLADQGKKVSVRMILEKSKLLNADQLAQIDRDLNIKVVKKRTGRMQQTKAPTGPVGAQSFGGDEVPEFSGMEGKGIDATVFSPPPADMQERIRQEREKAKAQAREHNDAEAAPFMGDDSGSPFDADPFAEDEAMAPQPAEEMHPGSFGDEVQPEELGQDVDADPFGEEMQPQAIHADQDDAFGREDDLPHEPQARELSRMDSSPKLTSLAAEFDGFASPDDEELPMIGDAELGEQHDWNEAEPAVMPGPPTYAGPPTTNIKPQGDDFSSFGNDIRSPEELESGMPTSREKTGAMDRTMFSPPPPGFHPRERARQQEHQPIPEPESDEWGEAGIGSASGFGEEAQDMDTMYSPPPTDMPVQSHDRPRGRQGHDDFADIELPTGKRMDDVPTAPSQGDSVHPLRRGAGASSSDIPVTRTTSRKVAVPDDFAHDELFDEELPGEADIDMAGSEPLNAAATGSHRLPPKAPTSKAKLPNTRKELAPSERAKPRKEKKEKRKGKRTSTRVMLLFLLLLVIVLAILITPVAYPNRVGFLDDLRNNENAKPIYDYVEQVYEPIRDLLGIPQPQPVPQRETRIVPSGSDSPDENNPGAGNEDGQPLVPPENDEAQSSGEDETSSQPDPDQPTDDSPRE